MRTLADEYIAPAQIQPEENVSQRLQYNSKLRGCEDDRSWLTTTCPSTAQQGPVSRLSPGAPHRWVTLSLAIALKISPART